MFSHAAGMPSEKPCVLGIDGGGTKTEWVLMEAGEIRHRGVLPQSNLGLNTDEQLLELFRVLPSQATHVGAFHAACATDEDRARLRRLVRTVWPTAQIAIGSDRDSAIAAAFRGDDGIVVIGGTGAAVHGRLHGHVEKAGGWGHVVGDRGGGYDLARQGLRQVLTQYDLEQRITPLTQRILRELALNSLHELAAWAMHADKMSVARLAPAMFAAARQGEEKMLGVIEAGAEVLADFTRAVAQRLEWADPVVRLFGGLFVHHEDYVNLFTLRLSLSLPDARVEVCTESGAIGAAWLAENFTGRPQRPVEKVDRTSLARAATEQGNPRSAQLDRMTPAEIVELFAQEEHAVAAALDARREELTAAVDLIGNAMAAGGRLFYAGAGTSGRLGVLDASEIPPTFGAPPEWVQGIMAGGATALQHAVEGAEDQREAGALAVRQRGVREGDIVCGLTASGRTPFVMGALEQGRLLGARTVLLTCNPTRDPHGWDVEIDLPTGAEIVTGSTRLKAGTATKVALNLFSTAAMVRLGRVRGNTMVDLGISNEKLRDRGARMVAEALNLSYQEARNRLAAANWDVRACLDSAGGG